MRAPLNALVLGLVALAVADPEIPVGGPSVTIPDEQGLPGVFGTHSSRPMRPGFMVIGASNRTASGSSILESGVITGPMGDESHQDVVVSSFRGFWAAGLGRGFDLSLSLPWYYESLGGAQAGPGPGEAWSLGDLSGIVKARLPWEIPFAALSVSAMASAPTSSGHGPLLPKLLAFHPASGGYPDPVAHPSGLAKPRAGLGAGISFDLSDAMEGPRVELHANVSGERTLADAPGPFLSLAASLAAEAYISRVLRLEAEFRTQRLASDIAGMASPEARETTLGAGLGWMTPIGLSMRLGGLVAPLNWNPYRALTFVPDQGGPGSLGYRLRPTLSGFIQIAWQGFPLGRDRDHDGVSDPKDRCPANPEDRDGFEDGDGCPEPDNDGDEIPDKADGCPYAPEDHDGFEDGDGCPEPDNDHDGSLDAADRCPRDAEDADGYQDEDGCPEADDDGDGIPDAMDKCPRSAENRNGVEDGDGCPETDTDGDGFPDSRDKCPREDEIINFYQDGDGCPDEKPEPVRDAILAGVEFQSEGSELLPASFPILDALAERLLAYPGTEIEIQGYLDDRSGAGAKAASLARAEAVAEYLSDRGVEARRMKPVGYGAALPLQSNRTAQGRAANRRIQIHRLN